MKWIQCKKSKKEMGPLESSTSTGFNEIHTEEQEELMLLSPAGEYLPSNQHQPDALRKVNVWLVIISFGLCNALINYHKAAVPCTSLISHSQKSAEPSLTDLDGISSFVISLVMWNGTTACPPGIRFYLMKVLISSIVSGSVHQFTGSCPPPIVGCGKRCIIFDLLGRRFDILQVITHQRGFNPILLVSVLQRQQKLLTSQPSEAWWWIPRHTQHWVILSVPQQCCPTCPLHTSRSVCDTWTRSPVQRSPRITCGWSTVRAKSPNPTGEFDIECLRLHVRCAGVLYCDISFSLYIFAAHLFILYISSVLPLSSFSLLCGV